MARSLDPAPQIRFGLLALLTAFTAVWGLLHQWVTAWKTAGVDALCPFGTLESAWALITRGQFLTKVGTSSAVLLAGTLLMSLLLRRGFCGQICPLGFLQELFGKLGARLGKKRPRLPGLWDRVLRGTKYLVLAGIAGLSWVFADLVVRPYDPWAAWMHLSSPEVLTEMAGGLALLGLGLAGSVFENRAFCRYACPMGAFLGLTSKVGLARIVRDVRTCINCKACTRACPVDIRVHELDQVTSVECLSCGLCAASCPVPNTLHFRLGRTGPSIPNWGLTAGTAVLLTTTMLVGAVAGQFSLLRQPPLRNAVELTRTPGSTAKLDIRGRDTLREVASLTDLDLEILLQKMGVEPQHADRPLKDLSADYPGLTPEVVRERVRALLNSSR